MLLSRMLGIVMAAITMASTATVDVGFCPSRDMLGYGPCTCSCKHSSATRQLCLPVRKRQCWPAMGIEPYDTADPCTLVGGMREAALGASPRLPTLEGKPLRSIVAAKAAAPPAFQLTVSRPGEDGAPAFVGSSEYAHLIARLGRKVGRALDDPAQSVNVYNVTGPGYQHVVTLHEANRNSGLPWEEMRARQLPFGAELETLMTRYLLPHATETIFGGAAPLVPRVVVSRNIHVPHEVFRTVAMLWHWDGLSDKSIKLLIYLTPVADNRSGCMLVMRHREHRRPWRMARKPVWGGDLRPPSIPQPWMLELFQVRASPTASRLRQHSPTVSHLHIPAPSLTFSFDVDVTWM